MTANDKFDPATDGWSPRRFKGIPASLGVIWTRQNKGNWRYAAQLDESHANAQGIIHGGVLMTFVDHALSLLVWEAAGRSMCSTTHLDFNFLKAIRPPAFVELDAKILRQGRSMAFAQGILRVGGAKVLAATGGWSIR